MELTKEQLAAWRQQGMSNIEIARMIGKSANTVNMLFSKYKIPPRDRSLPEKKRQDIIRMRKEGKGIKEISEELGVSASAANNYLKAVGLIPEREKKEYKPQNAYEPEVFTMAVQRKPKIIKEVYHGHRYENVTDLYNLG